MSPKVFISYKAEEFHIANWVRKKLEAAGISCWMAPASIPGGSNYAKEIPKAIQSCEVFVVILSKRAQKSKWVPKEVDQAINAGKLILPFCIEDCPLEEDFGFYLSNVQRYDAWRNAEGAIQDMLRDIRNAENGRTERDAGYSDAGSQGMPQQGGQRSADSQNALHQGRQRSEADQTVPQQEEPENEDAGNEDAGNENSGRKPPGVFRGARFYVVLLILLIILAACIFRLCGHLGGSGENGGNGGAGDPAGSVETGAMVSGTYAGGAGAPSVNPGSDQTAPHEDNTSNTDGGQAGNGGQSGGESLNGNDSQDGNESQDGNDSQDGNESQDGGDSQNSGDNQNAIDSQDTDGGQDETGGQDGTAQEEPELQEPRIDYNTNGRVRILNKKYAQKREFELLAARFQEESGIKVTVESPEHYSSALSSKITNSPSDPTLFMLAGIRDFEEYGSECLDLSDSAAAQELIDDSYALRGANGKLYGLACIVETYGLVVNTRLLKKAGYEVSDIRSFNSLKRIVEDITSRKKELGFSAFTSPSVGKNQTGYYRFAEHAPAVPLYYELKDNAFNIGIKLRGTYLGEFRGFIDLYLDNATVSRQESLSRSLKDAQDEFLQGKAVFHQDGSWSAEKLGSILEEEAEVVPLYMGIPGEEKQGINKTSTSYWCVNRHASEDDIEATLQFLQWAVTSEAGIRIMTHDMGFRIPYKRADVPDNLFLQTLRSEEEQGLEPIWQYYKYGDYTSWSNDLKNALAQYADGTGNWAAVEEAFISLW